MKECYKVGLRQSVMVGGICWIIHNFIVTIVYTIITAVPSRGYVEIGCSSWLGCCKLELGYDAAALFLVCSIKIFEIKLLWNNQKKGK